MQTSLVARLRCPLCGAALAITHYKAIGQTEIIDGLLTCPCGAVYLIYQGVPRMLPTHSIPADFAASYREQLAEDAPVLAENEPARSHDPFSFSFQWKMHAYGDLTWEMKLSERIALFYRYVSMRPDQVRGLQLLDAGCGNGTLSARLAADGLDVVAMDYSTSVYRAYEKMLLASHVNNQTFERLHYVQGDVQQPPFEPGTFDLVYCDGVLHHTPDTRKSFLALAPVVKPGGRIFVWLYRSDTRPRITFKNRAFELARFLTRRLSYKNKRTLCAVAAFVLLLGVRAGHLFGYKRRPLIPLRQKTVNLFDSLTPQFNHLHRPEEVKTWFKEAGYTEIEEVTRAEHGLDEGGFALIGRRERVASAGSANPVEPARPFKSA